MRYKAFWMLIIVSLICFVSCGSPSNNGSERDNGECDINFYDGAHLYCSTSVDIGERVTEPTEPQREGYDFVGWYSKAQKWDFFKHKTEGDLILEARWRIDFKDMFPWYADDGIEIDEGGAYLKIDTNPNDENGAVNEVLLKRIKEVNERLELPNNLYGEMISVSSDNVQVTFNEFVTVEWTNTPQTGLCVTYTRK